MGRVYGSGPYDDMLRGDSTIPITARELEMRDPQKRRIDEWGHRGYVE